MKLYDSDFNCSGCSACYSVCPKSAINMIPNKEGFLYPVIDESKCVNCGLCLRVCNFKIDLCKQSNLISTNIPRVFGVKHIDQNTRLSSRSGGFFTAISDWVLARGGTVYGVVWDSNFRAIHYKATTPEERNAMRGSKYVQSDKINVFHQVKMDLQNGKYVLFTGTSCEIAGLKGYLTTQYPSLICVDIICHGASSPLILKEFLEWSQKKQHAEIVSVDLRNKRKFGWRASTETIIFKSHFGTIFEVDSKIYSKLFYSHSAMRLSCSICPYKSIIHPGDITIGDFWGIEKFDSNFDDNCGISLVLINSAKGDFLFEEVKDQLVLVNTSIENAMQPPLAGNWSLPKARKAFWYIYDNRDFDYLVRVFCESGGGLERFLNFIRKIYFIIRAK